jgi:uracil-DNA glycosylase
MDKIDEISWQTSLEKEFSKPYFLELKKKIVADKRAGNIILPFPVDSMVYRAFNCTPLYRTKVVILGQDPYPNIKDAIGMAFSVPGLRPAPPTLRNMFKELKHDTGINNTFNDLSFWAYQGVFLLNSILTTLEGIPLAHKNYGWEQFTDKVLETTCKYDKSMIYWLMGSYAQKKKDIILEHSKGKAIIIETPHPSPQSAHTGFFFSKPFSRINNLLIAQGKEQIDWRL